MIEKGKITSTEFVVKLLAVVVVTLAVLPVVPPPALQVVTLTAAAHTVSPALTLGGAALPAALSSQRALVPLTHRAVTELTHKVVMATATQPQTKGITKTTSKTQGKDSNVLANKKSIFNLILREKTYT